MSEVKTDDRVTVTLEFLQALASAQQALRERTAEVRQSEHYSANNAAGRMIREGVERSLQQADLLRGWCERQRIALKISEDEVRYV